MKLFDHSCASWDCLFPRHYCILTVGLLSFRFFIKLVGLPIHLVAFQWISSACPLTFLMSNLKFKFWTLPLNSCFASARTLRRDRPSGNCVRWDNKLYFSTCKGSEKLQINTSLPVLGLHSLQTCARTHANHKLCHVLVKCLYLVGCVPHLVRGRVVS